MEEFYYIFRHNTQQYYHSLTPRGCPVWVDHFEQCQWLTEKEARELCTSMVNSSSYLTKALLEVKKV